MDAKILSVLALSVLVMAAPVIAAEPSKGADPKSGEPKKDAQAACMEMMQGSAPQAMNGAAHGQRRSHARHDEDDGDDGRPGRHDGRFWLDRARKDGQ